MLTFTKKQIILIGGLVLVLVILGFFVYERLSPTGLFATLQNDLKRIDPGETKPAYTDLDGNPINLSQFKGKPLVINSWASWMPFSKDELSNLSTLHDTYGDTVVFLAMNRMEQVPIIRSYIDTYSISKNIIFLLDPSDNFYTVVGGYAMPETLFYRADGTLEYHARGVLSKGDLTQHIEAIITK